jgi:hypothetical protein
MLKALKNKFLQKIKLRKDLITNFWSDAKKDYARKEIDMFGVYSVSTIKAESLITNYDYLLLSQRNAGKEIKRNKIQFNEFIEKEFKTESKPVVFLGGFTGEFYKAFRKKHSNAIFSDLKQDWVYLKGKRKKRVIADYNKLPFNPEKISSYFLFEPYFMYEIKEGKKTFEERKKKINELFSELTKPKKGVFIANYDETYSKTTPYIYNFYLKENYSIKTITIGKIKVFQIQKRP